MGAGACLRWGPLTGGYLRGSVRGSVGDTRLVGLNINDLSVAGSVSLVSGLVSECVAAFHESSLCVLASVDEVGVVEGKLNGAVQDMVSSLNTKHEGVLDGVSEMFC